MIIKRFGRLTENEEKRIRISVEAKEMTVKVQRMVALRERGSWQVYRLGYMSCVSDHETQPVQARKLVDSAILTNNMPAPIHNKLGFLK